MAHCHFTDFDITIHGHQAPYLVHAAYRHHAATGTFDADAAQPDWAAQLQHLAQTRGIPGQRFLERLGAELFALLFHDDVRELWVRARTELDSGGGAGLCIRLMAPAPAVAALPWEAMFDPDRNVAFAGSLQTPLVRVEKLLRHVGHVRELATTLPLRLLIALPEDPTGQIDGDAEERQLVAALGPLVGSSVELVTLRGRFSVVELRQMITRTQPAIVHLVTHGQADGVLLWQHDTPVITAAAALRVALEGAHSVRLVVLNACATAQGAIDRGLASAGAQLLQSGMPAVIAMQFEIEERTASDFAQFFYQELLGGQCPGAVHRAVSFARSNLYALNPESIGYTTPVLWLNAADGAIFTVTKLPPAKAALHQLAAPPPPVTLKPLQHQRDELERWRNTMTALSDAVLPMALRATVQRPLQLELKEIDDLLVQLHGLDRETPTEPVCKQYEEKLARIIAKQNSVDRLAAIIRDQQK